MGHYIECDDCGFRHCRCDDNKAVIETEKKNRIGGTFTIPDGWFVFKVDLDTEEPYCKILPEGFFAPSEEEKKILIPKSLAYYLSTHDNGSNKFRNLLRVQAQNELRAEFEKLFKRDDRDGI